MGIVGIMVVNGDPLQGRAKSGFQIGHHLADEGSEVSKRRPVLRADDQAEVPAVIDPAGGQLLSVETALPLVVERKVTGVLTPLSGEIVD